MEDSIQNEDENSQQLINEKKCVDENPDDHKLKWRHLYYILPIVRFLKGIILWF